MIQNEMNVFHLSIRAVVDQQIGFFDRRYVKKRVKKQIQILKFLCRIQTRECFIFISLIFISKNK